MLQRFASTTERRMSITLTRLDGTRAAVAAADLASFQAGFRGALIGPDDPAYDDTRRIWNAMIDRRPGLILRCTGAADVVQAVRFARQHRALLSVRGGGHNIAGLAVCEGGLMIDLSPMRGVWVDSAGRRALAQAGCTLADLDRETQLHGLAAVMGFVSATGIAGLTVGGGFGYLTRQHGWTCDNLLGMDVVCADGELRHVSADDDPELFWAMRGGGGNFGIATAFEYRLHPVGPQILGGAIAWRGDDAAGVLDAWRRWIATTPRELTSVAVLRRAPAAPWLPQEVHGQPIVAVFVCHTGGIEQGQALLSPLRAHGRPVADIVVPRPYTQMQSLLDATQPKGRRYYWKSHYLPAVTADAAACVVAQAGRIASPHSAILLFQIGGVLNELPADHSPAGNRDAQVVLNIAASWEQPADDAAHVAWARNAFQAMRPYATGGTYVNFLTEEEGADRIAAAYGRPALERLAALKRRFDPDNLFRHTKPVG
jgi:FAD/FMN-containing dehydrogenase